jgi:hypothetical protein
VHDGEQSVLLQCRDMTIDNENSSLKDEVCNLRKMIKMI